MEMHHIRYFLALSETLNLTKAAEQCNVSPSALSRAIKALETEFAPRGPDENQQMLERGFHKPGDVENRLGYHVGQLGS